MAAAEDVPTWEVAVADALARIRQEGMAAPLTEREVRQEMNRLGIINAGVLTMCLTGGKLLADREIAKPVTLTHNQVAEGHGIHPLFTKAGDPSPARVVEEAAIATRLMEIEAELNNPEGFYGS